MIEQRTRGTWIVNACTSRGTPFRYRWEITTEEGSDAEVIATVPVDLLTIPERDEVAESNAYYIVLAVNNHERLVTELGAMVAALDEVNIMDLSKLPVAFRAALTQARATLKDVKAQEVAP